MTENPWARLPDRPPYVYPDDSEAVLGFNARAEKKGHQDHILRLDLIPEPFVGSPKAPVVLLGNNPGVSSDETAELKQQAAFVSRMRENLLHRLSGEYPFLYLDPDPAITPPGKKWWDRKLKSLFLDCAPNESVARSILARSLLAVEFFPYPSRRYAHGKLSLASQDYSFGLVREAVKRGAVIILTRGKRRWLSKVPELEGCQRLIQLKEVQRAIISPQNCLPSEGYQAILSALKAPPSAPPGGTHEGEAPR